MTLDNGPQVEYTVLLEVRVIGPDTDWKRVAYALAGRVADLKWGDYFVRETGVDEGTSIAG